MSTDFSCAGIGAIVSIHSLIAAASESEDIGLKTLYLARARMTLAALEAEADSAEILLSAHEKELERLTKVRA